MTFLCPGSPVKTLPAPARLRACGRRSTRGSRCAAPPRSCAPRRPPRTGGADETHPAAWHLARAAGQLTAGRDLLHTHFSSDPSGAWTRTSSWAKVIYSPPVTDAMLGEIGRLAAKLAPWMMRLSLHSTPESTMPATAGLTLHDSSRWLWTAGLKLETHVRQHPPAEDARLVLAAIPSGLPPAHNPVAATETVPELCRGVIITAARLQHAAARVRPDRPLVPPGHLPFLGPRRARLSDHGA